MRHICVGIFALLLISLPLAAQSNPAVFPTGLTFGYLPTGTTGQQTVSVYNIGNVNITVNSITPSVSQYTVVSGTLPITLTPGQRADYSIQFKPTAARAYSAHLTVTTTGLPNETVTLNGNGSNPAAVPSLNTSSMTFSSQELGTASPAQALTITNTGTTSVSLTNVVVTYPFSQTGWTSSTAIAPGKSFTLNVTYRPTAVASQPGTIALTYNIAPPQGVSLKGSGANPTQMGIGTYPTLPAGTHGYLYQATLNAVGGTPPYNWLLQSGSSLPAGLSLSTDGIISGTIASTVGVGNYSFTVQARDSSQVPVTVSSLMTLPVGAYSGNKNCNNISVNAGDGSGPMVPISDLGTNFYLSSEEGGLYANGSNLDDAGHDTFGQNAAAAIVPLDSNGNYSPTGKEVFISIGLSMAQQPFSEFVQLVNTDPAKNPNVVVVNGATGGATASLLAGVNNNFWNAMIYDYLPNAGVTPNQVVAAWVLDVNGGPSGTFPSDMTNLQNNLQSIAQNLLVKFPNIKIAYYSSVNYTGYSDGVATLDPEPYGYEGGFAVKNAIEDQIGGDPNMNYDSSIGKVKAPWIAWGPYYWANGMIPRSDGLVWTCQDSNTDGTHPADPVGRIKISTQLLNFLKTDDTASKWFLAPGAK
ncbi:MAG TPA: choice-of-anchor D domain-containing protein [Candidatus Dormibacteraeota bacterium]|nr:choice-of-anchor D domain-containing protein [Candidatus Dormibacteraeota bacterium]